MRDPVWQFTYRRNKSKNQSRKPRNQKPEECKTQMSLNSKQSIPVTITDTLTNVTTTYHSTFVAAKYSKIAARTINKYKNTKTLYKGRYLIS